MENAGDTVAARALNSHGAVSFPGEELLLVDHDDQLQGYGSKAQLHAGDGRLHRAFSVFLFDQEQRLLLHRRSQAKPLWPGFWTNSCCSHPRRGEALEQAVHRRVREELGVNTAQLQHVYGFEYHARYERIGSEHEYCHVFLAQLANGQQPLVHRDEIAEWGWFTMEEVDGLLAGSREELTPWFCMEWEALRGRYQEALASFSSPVLGPLTAA